MSCKPLIMAHRGASGIVGQDNTLLAFSRAIELECDMIELDVRRTDDGNIVCFHDPQVADMPVAAMTHPGLIDRSGLDVPLLADVLSLCRGQIKLNIEIKELGYAREVLAELADTYRPEDFIVTSFRDKALLNTAAANPQVTTGLIVGAPPAGRSASEILNELPARLEACRASCLSLHHSLICDELFDIPALRQRRIVAWTVDDPRRMRQLLQYPLFAICSNRPDYLIEVLERPAKKLTRQQATILAETENEDSLLACLAGAQVDDILIPTRQIRIGAGVAAEAGHWASAFWGENRPIAVVMDANTRQIAGQAVCDQIPRAQLVQLEPLAGWTRLTPHDTLVEEVKKRTAHAEVLIAVGSGTVNDLVKYAAHQTQRPYFVVATAPSMNGYAAPLAALVVNELKQPLPATPPIAVIADTDILTAAPVDMTRSGYADLLARSSCSADHRLASHMAGEKYDELPRIVVNSGIDQCIQVAEAIGEARREGVEVLTRAIMLSSFSMVLAGGSAPASGGEHLISHYWDMTSYLDHRLPPASHGYQVCLGTLMSAKLYSIMRQMDPATFQSPPVETEEQLQKLHGTLWNAIREQRKSPALDPALAPRRLEQIREKWERIWRDLTPLLTDPETVKKHYRRAQVPLAPAAHQLSREWVRHTFVHACDVRGRYTVLHFARDAGILEKIADQVLSILD